MGTRGGTRGRQRLPHLRRSDIARDAPVHAVQGRAQASAAGNGVRAHTAAQPVGKARGGPATKGTPTLGTRVGAKIVAKALVARRPGHPRDGGSGGLRLCAVLSCPTGAVDADRPRRTGGVAALRWLRRRRSRCRAPSRRPPRRRRPLKTRPQSSLWERRRNRLPRDPRPSASSKHPPNRRRNRRSRALPRPPSHRRPCQPPKLFRRPDRRPPAIAGNSWPTPSRSAVASASSPPSSASSACGCNTATATGGRSRSAPTVSRTTTGISGASRGAGAPRSGDATPGESPQAADASAQLLGLGSPEAAADA